MKAPPTRRTWCRRSLETEKLTKIALIATYFVSHSRLFSSIAAAWKGCNEGTSDVKELVPEFFYEPEFLRNADDHALGTRQVRKRGLSRLPVLLPTRQGRA